jgi:hypothetical protein
MVSISPNPIAASICAGKAPYIILLPLISDDSPPRVSLNPLLSIRPLQTELESLFLTELLDFAIVTLIPQSGRRGQDEGTRDDDGNEWKPKEEKWVSRKSGPI